MPAGLKGKPGRPRKPVDIPDYLTVPTSVPNYNLLSTDYARDEWRRVTPYLEILGKVAEIDKLALCQYCEQWSIYQTAMEVTKNPHFDLFPSNSQWEEAVAPEVDIETQLAACILPSAIKFGMTPLSRVARKGDKAIPPELMELGNAATGSLQIRSRDRTIAADAIGPWNAKDVEPPEWMTELAFNEFLELRELLVRHKLFTPLDFVPLSILCSLFEIRKRMLEQMSGLLTSHKKTFELKAHPVIKQCRAIDDVLNSYQPHFAIGPKSRYQFRSQHEEAKSVKLAIYLGGA